MTPAFCHVTTAARTGPAKPSVWWATASLCALLCGATATDAAAQAVYRIVGPDGKVSYSDRPPQDPKTTVAPAKVGATGSSPPGATDTASNPALPFALQQVVNRYPAVLYTAKDCPICDHGRTLLTQRGVPFTEKTVNTREDQAAFKRINADNSLPLLVLGSQQIKGYSESEWQSYLDAANYPKASALPRTYQPTPPEPLAPLKTAAEAPPPPPQDKPPATRLPPSVTPPPNPNNPAGIKF
jgi:glutaredoxin